MLKKFLLIFLAIFSLSYAKGELVKEIYLAGGCFWGMEGYFSRIKGVESTQVGYANGNGNKTSYYEIKNTGHAETLLLSYDATKISLKDILAHFWRVIDPYSLNRQGNDVGVQYRSGIYFTNKDDESVIREFLALKQEQDKSKKIAIEVEPLKNFVVAEEYHQKYLEKNPNGYCHIDLNLANEPLHDDSRFKVPSRDELKLKLSPQAYEITQNKGTERAGTSPLDKNYEKGIYVDAVTKKPLFASTDKFDSGSGWPSFTKPITGDTIEYKKDFSYGMSRIEVSSKLGGSHLGHVFNDGPIDKGGLRYCINGASLEFIPLEKMDELGYADYKRYVK